MVQSNGTRRGVLAGLVCAAGIIGLTGCPPRANLDHDLDGFTPAEGDCNDDNDTIHPDAFDAACDGLDQDCDGVDPVLVLEATRPINGEIEVYYRSLMVVDLAGPLDPWQADVDATLRLVDPDGGIVETEPMDQELPRLQFRPLTELSQETSYTAELDVPQCVTAAWSFETSDVGNPVEPAAAEGGDFLLVLGAGTYLEPPGIGNVLAQYLMDLHIVVHLVELDDQSGTAVAFSGFLAENDPPEQDLCIATTNWDGEEHQPVSWDNPHFASAPYDFPFMPGAITGVDNIGWAHDVITSGDIAPDGDSMAGVTFDGFVDTRFMDQLVDPSLTEGATCELLASLGVPCTACPDDLGTFCLDVLIDLIPAQRIDLTGTHPDTGEPLDTLIEVSHEQIESWQASGHCP